MWREGRLVVPNLVTIHSCQLYPAGVSSFYSQTSCCCSHPAPLWGLLPRIKGEGGSPVSCLISQTPHLDSFLAPFSTEDPNETTCLPRSLSLRRKRPRPPQPLPRPQLLSPPRNLPLIPRVSR